MLMILTNKQDLVLVQYLIVPRHSNEISGGCVIIKTVEIGKVWFKHT